MATKKKEEKKVKAPEVPQPSQVVESVGVPVKQHLDRDPNDPRNRPETPKLPSLDDPGQS